MKPEHSLPALFLSNITKPQPSQRLSKVQCKKPAKKNISILRFYVRFVHSFYGDFSIDIDFWKDLMVF